MSTPLIAYVGPVAVPGGGAAARRMLGVAKSLREAGFDLCIGAGQVAENGHSVTACEGIAVHALGERQAAQYPLASKHLAYFAMGRRTRQWLNALEPAPAAVILYSGYSPYFARLLPWCERRGVPLVFDAVEWYDWANVTGGRFGAYRWNIELAMRYYCVRSHHVLAISSYLERYYASRGCRTVRVPPTLDVAAIAPRLDGRLWDGASLFPLVRRPVTIAYAGEAGNKDLIDNVVEAVLRLDAEGRRFQLNLVGVGEDEVLRLRACTSRGVRQLTPAVRAFGRTDYATALDIVRAADFTALLRPRLRYAEAGFPTKVVESLALGTPVICNHTSDLASCVRDGDEGLVCADHGADSLVKALLRAEQLSLAELLRMRAAARRQAEQSFDYRQHVTSLGQFMREICESAGSRAIAAA
jgi:glycosyltransferase involved in cell wall biosynthesis